MAKKKALNKNQLQELLLGVGLCLRDYELSFTDQSETTLPDFLANSKMNGDDGIPIGRILQLLVDALHHEPGYVSN